MAATLQRKLSGGIIFVIVTKIVTKIVVPRNYVVVLSARMVTQVVLVSPVSNEGLKLRSENVCLPYLWVRLAETTAIVGKTQTRKSSISPKVATQTAC